MTASFNNAVVSTVGAVLTDASGNTWSFNSNGQLVYNTVAKTATSGIVKLAYVSATIWSENTSNNWYSYTSAGATLTGPVASPLLASANDSYVTTVGPTIVDSTGNSWAITSGAQLSLNGVADTNTSNIQELAYVNAVIWGENTSGNWYSYSATGAQVSGPAASPLPVVQSFGITTPAQQNTNAAFSVTGTIQGYSAAPTLQYRDDSGTWAALPSGATVSTTAFTFTNPGLAAGTHTVSVRDANANTVAVSSGSFNVVTVVVPTIAITTPSLPVTSTAFTVSGKLGNYAAVPTLTYSDDSGVATALPSGSTVTTSTFTFLHPGLAAGSHTILISDGTNSGTASYTVSALSGSVSPNDTTITPGTGSIIDASAHRWTITTAGQVAVNGVVDTTTANVIEMAWVSSTIWYESASELWFSKITATSAWSPTAGTTSSPLPAVPTLTVNMPVAVTANTTFIVTGSLVNYKNLPSLTYSDNGGAATALPTGSTVTSTTFSFTHPGMPSSTATLTISDGTRTATVTYTITTTSAASGWMSVVGTTGTSLAITGLEPNSTYQMEVYGTNPVGQGPTSATISFTTAPLASLVLPGSPTGLAPTAATNTTVNLGWVAPSIGTTPFSYITQYSLSGANLWSSGPSVSSPSAQVTGLTANTAYDFAVAAVNSVGTGMFSALTTVTTSATAPPAVTWNASGASSTITLSNGALTATSGGSSTAGASPQGCLSTTAITATSGFRQFECTMVTGTGDWGIGIANQSATFVAGFGGNGNAAVFYANSQQLYCNGAAPLTNGSVASANGDVVTCVFDPSVPQIWITTKAMRNAGNLYNNSKTATPATNTGGISLAGLLTVGNYSIAFYEGESGGVCTLNAGATAFTYPMPGNTIAWNGTAAAIVIPAAVTNLAGAIGANSIVLTWSTPATGTAAFTYYVQQALHGGTLTTVQTVTANTATLTGLTAGSAYDFAVYAGNSAGNSTTAVLSNVLIPATPTVPGQVIGVSSSNVTANQLQLSWQAPTSGTAPTGYQVMMKLSTASTYTPYSTAQTPAQMRTAMLTWLNSLSTNHVISIQHLGGQQSSLTTVNNVYTSSGQYVGGVGGGYYDDSGSDTNIGYQFNATAIAYWNAGGVVTISQGWPNPSGGGALGGSVNITDLLTTGSTTQNAWFAILAQNATGLLALQNAGVVTFLRPIHEMNGNWNWWGTQNISPSQYQQLWIITYNYLVNVQGLTSIIWVYAVNGGSVGAPSGSTLLSWYPGDAYVDIVGFDNYTSTPANDASAVYTPFTQANSSVNFAANKLIAYCEFGSGSASLGDSTYSETNLISCLQNNMPRAIYWCQWWDGNGGNEGWGMDEVQNISTALNNSYVWNRGNTAKPRPATGTTGAATTTSLTQTITGLTAGATYDFEVYAFNAVGNGTSSSPAVVVTTP